MTTLPCDSPEDFCLTHGYEYMRRLMGNPVPFCEACEAERSLSRAPAQSAQVTPASKAMLDLASKINLSYLVTLNANGPTEKHLSGDELSYIVAALRIVGSRSAHLPAQPPAAPVEMPDEGKEWIVPHEDCLNCRCSKEERCAGWKEHSRSSADNASDYDHGYGVGYEDGFKEQQKEIDRLRERLGPRGLEVVEIDGAGHYVNEKVKAEIDRLRAEPQGARK